MSKLKSCDRQYEKKVPVGTTMHPGRRLMVGEEVLVVVFGVVDSIDGPHGHKAWECVIY